MAGLVAVALLWLVWLAAFLFGVEPVGYGIFPRRPGGLMGVLTAPLFHGSWNHLLANSGPVLILVTTVIYGYPRSALPVGALLYLGTGLLVWLAARPAWHLGASGVTFGLAFFLFVIGVLRRDRRAIALALSVFLLYGGMLAGLLPGDAGVSFESHLAGAGLGCLAAYLFRNRDPRPAPRRYDWEGKDDDDGDSGN